MLNTDGLTLAENPQSGFLVYYYEKDCGKYVGNNYVYKTFDDACDAGIHWGHYHFVVMAKADLLNADKKEKTATLYSSPGCFRKVSLSELL